jgi:beta-glucosidase/6-phospho-beta-glucosidase/beta-galactosidase
MTNLVRAHRAAYAAIHDADRLRAASRPGAPASVGIVLNWSKAVPAEPASRADRAAALRWDRFFHHAILDAARTGLLDIDFDGAGDRRVDDLPPCALDYVGVNYYTRVEVASLPGAIPPVDALPGYAEMRLDPLGAAVFDLAGARVGPREKDDFGREVYPEGLRVVARDVFRRTGLPILITENGLPDARDEKRAAYLRAHLEALEAAVFEDGTPLMGYLHWTLVDNYEWGSFAPKTGLYRLDRARSHARVRTRGSEELRRFMAE